MSSKTPQGIRVWRNPKNKFVIFELHYEANPAKRTEAFKEAVKSAMPRAQYLQEYELQWDSFEGAPVYGDFDKKIHVQENLLPQVGLPLIRGWDFGMTPACVVAQLQESRLVIFKEWTSFSMGIDRFSDIVLRDCQMLFPGYSYLDFIDPAGFSRVDTDENTCAMVMAGKGMKIAPGAITWEDRRSSVESFLLSRTKDGPNLLISQKNCPILVRGFDGGYRYPDSVIDLEPSKVKPLKDEHSHPHDALQMVATGINMIKNKKPSVRIPGASYGWTFDKGMRSHG